MSKNITEWIKYDLYPALFRSINTAFPEHNFNWYNGGWRSNTYLNGETHSRPDKTVVTEKAPGRILEQGGDNLSLVDYVMRRDSVEFIDAVKTLARAVSLSIPKGDIDQEQYKKYKDKSSILEYANSYFIYCLENSENAENIKAYLSNRGYSDEDIEAMELGYIPGQDKLYKNLQERGYSKDQIEQALKLNSSIGNTHNLVIPYRSGGILKGFKFRTTGDHSPKYLNSTGLDRTGGFFNISGLKRDRDIVIVEGELDSLAATVRGVDNVVATGGNSINTEQVKDAIKRGAKSFTVCLDYEPGKEEETTNKVNNAIKVILDEGVSNVYIVSLPNIGGKTDPDRLIKESGVDSFKELIEDAIPYYKYKLQGLITKYGEIEKRKDRLTSKDIDKLLDEVVETANNIPNAIDRDRYKRDFISLEAIKDYGITEESLDITLNKLTSTKEKEAQDKELKQLLTDAAQMQSKGETNKALELISSKVKEVRITGATGLLPTPMSYDKLMDEIATLPPSYRTGYNSLDKFVGFTPGAITLIAGRPSHGKTTFMFNLLLEMSNLYNENFYFFTYEEPVKNISIKLLNRLIGKELKGYFRDEKDLPTPTNYEFLKSYIRKERTDIAEVEEGKYKLKDLIDSQRIKVIDRNYSVEELSSLIAYLNKKEKIGAVFMDYIQRMRTETKTQDMRTKIAHISDSVLQIAKENGLPIILGAQLNRATQDHKEPRLENLKEAGNLEEDANTVLSVYNESREKDEDSDGGSYGDKREVSLQIKALKNREGEVNRKAILTFDKWTGVVKEQEEKPF